MRKSSVAVYGVGMKGDKYPTHGGKVQLKEYTLWVNMLKRCTQKYWDKHPTYNGIICFENFKSYTFFYEWCHKQIGFKSKDENGKSWNLDKDLLVKGNKVYSEDTCCFVPQRINALFTKSDASRGENPVGVTWKKANNKFVANCNNGSGKYAYLGYFQTQEEAFLAYKTFKEALIKEVANEYKEQLDPRAYEVLLNYEVDIND